MFFSTAGISVAGCSTLAPKYASSEASSNPMTSMRCACRHSRGSVVINSLDVGPDLDSAGIQRRADDGSREVRSAPAEGGGYTLGRRSDETAHHGNLVGLQERFYVMAQSVTGPIEQWNRSGVRGIRNYAVTGIEQHRVDPARCQSGTDDSTRDQFTRGKDVVGATRSQFAQR